MRLSLIDIVVLLAVLALLLLAARQDIVSHQPVPPGAEGAP